MRSKNAKDKLTEAIIDPTTSEVRMKALKKSQELAGTAVLLATKAMPRRGEHFFSLNKTLLGKNAQVKWCQIVDAQVGAANWTDLQGNVQEIARENYVESFRDCIKFHLLSVFSHDSREQQKY